jgi:hypothetical protein
MSKRKKRAIFYCSPLVFLVGVLIFGKVKLNQIEANAMLLAQTGQATIKLLGEYRSGIEKFVVMKDAAQIEACIDDAYKSERASDWNEKLKTERDGVRTFEWEIAPERNFNKTEAIEQMKSFLKPVTEIQESKFKLDTVEQIINSEESIVRGFLWLRGLRAKQTNNGEEVFESQAYFRLWLRKIGGQWKINRQELIRGQTVTGDRKGFTDITKDSGIDFVSRFNPLFETPEWYPKTFEIIKFGPAGVSAIDYDNDSWYDIFFADGAGARLYKNIGGAKFKDVTQEVGLPVNSHGINVGIFADFDNDGFKDVFLGGFTGASRIFKNIPDPLDNSKRHFVEVLNSGLFKKGDGDFVTVAAAGDYDNDGLLDLYLGRYFDVRKHLPTTLFYTRNGEGNSLLHNDGNFHFTDVTEKAGINETGATLGVTFGDYDNDGDADIHVANDYGRNALLRNNGNGTFTDVTKESGALDFGYGMSSVFADVNNDGQMDIYFASVHSGQRWYGQAATLNQYLLTSIKQGTIFEDFAAYKEIYQNIGLDWSDFGGRVVKGNTLLMNDGKGNFKQVTEDARANPFGWYWSSAVFDYDNDGRQDIYSVNGWITGKKTDDL